MLYPKLNKKEKKMSFWKKIQKVMFAKRSVFSGIECCLLFLAKSFHF